MIRQSYCLGLNYGYSRHPVFLLLSAHARKMLIFKEDDSEKYKTTFSTGMDAIAKFKH